MREHAVVVVEINVLVHPGHSRPTTTRVTYLASPTLWCCGDDNGNDVDVDDDDDDDCNDGKGNDDADGDEGRHNNDDNANDDECK